MQLRVPGILVGVLVVVACGDSPVEPDPAPVDRGDAVMFVSVPDELTAGVEQDIGITLFNRSDELESDVVVMWCLEEYQQGSFCTADVIVPMHAIAPGETLQTTISVTAPLELAGDTVQLRVFERGLGNTDGEPFPDVAMLLSVVAG